ncbi:monooxygenase 1-like [Papaver somniferum]|uniref:monooxygenase 1-like n=1 Tax=Papaver somniferum TaxID=3469 RepID=UPI000E6FB289|nr:monooxygenase 1-like [Papaver somniferum]
MSTIRNNNYIEAENKIVIVGGGICGLATALALHKKGLESIVLERSDKLRTTGATILIHSNGWRALDQLGVGDQLRKIGNLITAYSDISLDDGKKEEASLMEEELRCLKRLELVQVLADNLPLNTIRFGCHTVAVKMDPLTCQPIVQLDDGTSIKCEVVIGCDGVNSVVSEYVGLKTPRNFSTRGVRGFTSYPSGHGFSNDFIRIRKGNRIFCRNPVNENLMYWFVGLPCTSCDLGVSSEPELIKQATIKSIMDFPPDVIEFVQKTDLDSLTLTNLRYRPPWDLSLGNFRKGTVVVAGDAMHIMGPFLGQGGSAALEDAVVLARNLAEKMCGSERSGKQSLQVEIGVAIDRYVKERRMRLIQLSSQTYLIGMLLEPSSGKFTKLLIILALVVFFSNPSGHVKYNCGHL